MINPGSLWRLNTQKLQTWHKARHSEWPLKTSSRPMQPQSGWSYISSCIKDSNKIKAGCWTKLQTYRFWSWFFLQYLVNSWTVQHLFLCHNGTEGTQPCKASNLDCMPLHQHYSFTHSHHLSKWFPTAPVERISTVLQWQLPLALILCGFLLVNLCDHEDSTKWWWGIFPSKDS